MCEGEVAGWDGVGTQGVLGGPLHKICKTNLGFWKKKQKAWLGVEER